MLDWGDALVKELAARRCIIFLGAGASAGCPSSNGAHSPTWSQLLRMLNQKVRNHPAEKILAETLIADQKYLDAAEVIRSSIVHADYVDTMRQIFERPRFSPSSIHKSVLKIDPKIVITTNFDTVYDLYCKTGNAHEGYNTFKPADKHLVSELRSPTRCVIKAHGCITVPDSMVLTRSEFFKARQDAPYFFRILDALFLTHTILFIGYSLGDPDIQITLENSNISAPSSHKHYFVTEAGTPPAIRRAFENTYNVEFLEHQAKDFNDLYDALDALATRVEQAREENPAV